MFCRIENEHLQASLYHPHGVSEMALLAFGIQHFIIAFNLKDDLDLTKANNIFPCWSWSGIIVKNCKSRVVIVSPIHVVKC